MTRMEEFERAIGGVLVYDTTGTRGVHGQTVGADGSGQFAITIYGTPDAAERESLAIIRKMESAGYGFRSAIFVPNDENRSYFRNPLSFVRATP